MIRVSIIADPLERAKDLAEVLGHGDRLEVVYTGRHVEPGLIADVTVAIGLPYDELRRIHTPVVVLGEANDRARLSQRVLASLPPNAPLEAIEAAVLSAAQDLLVLTQEQSRRWLRTEAVDSDTMAPETLTERELQVLRALADGLANKEIATLLGMSEHTAKFHVSQILAKLGVASRAEAVAIGMRRGLVPL